MKSKNSKAKVYKKRPISILLVTFLGIVFLFILINYTIESVNHLYGFFICLVVFTPIFFIISIIFLFINKGKNKRRTIYFLISSITIILLFIGSIIGTINAKGSYMQANDYFEQKKYELAIEKYLEVINKDEDEYKITNSLNKIKKAKAYIKETNEHITKGDEYSSENKLEKALVEYEKAYDIYPYSLGLETEPNNKGTIKKSEKVKNILTKEEINKSPIANAGNNIYCKVGEKVTLDAKESYDPDKDSLTYLWHISGEEKQGREIKISFDNPGYFTVSLEVSDGKLSSIDTVDITVKGNETTSKEKETINTINYQIIYEDYNARYDNSVTYYVLIDPIDVSDNSSKNDIKNIIREMVNKKGNKISINIFDNIKALKNDYAYYVKGKTSILNDPEYLEYEKYHYIAGYDGSLKTGLYLNTLYFFYPDEDIINFNP